VINIKQPPGIDLIGQRELYNYLSEMATEINREILTIEERLNSLDTNVENNRTVITANADSIEQHTADIAALDQRVTALENE
jgi:polyhydroxyalkanoate synthesis regulator phasin